MHTLGKKSAFSLVELAIVLAALGLLVGGILSGRALIRASELRSVTTQYNQYIVATRVFRDKYFSLPGDMPNATKVWGAVDPTPSICASTPSTTVATCDGNGDGRIEDLISFGMPVEYYRFWQHLANAGLILGQYTGDPNGPPDNTRLPIGKLNSSLWWVEWWGKQILGTGGWFDGEYGNMLLFGKTTDDRPDGAILLPSELWNIDTKLDDGKPATGSIVAAGSLSTCTTTLANDTSTLSASYLLTSQVVGCAIIFRNLF